MVMKTLFICIFSIVMGVWYIHRFRAEGGKWLYVGFALTAFGVIVLGLELAGIVVVPR